MYKHYISWSSLWFSISYPWNEPTIRRTDCRFLFRLANLQNQRGIRYFFPPIYIHTHWESYEWWKWKRKEVWRCWGTSLLLIFTANLFQTWLGRNTGFIFLLKHWNAIILIIHFFRTSFSDIQKKLSKIFFFLTKSRAIITIFFYFPITCSCCFCRKWWMRENPWCSIWDGFIALQ